MGKPALQLVGQQFGNYTVISKAKNDKSGSTYWNCLCNCGTEKALRGYDLNKGRTKSCGCLRKERFIETKPKSAINSIYFNYKKHAIEKGRNFTLTKTEFGKLIQKSCYYCRTENSNKFMNSITRFSFFYNGIDRKDNNLGYTSNNVVPCCKICNQWKKALTLKEFRDHIFRLTKNYSSWAS